MAVKQATSSTLRCIACQRLLQGAVFSCTSFSTNVAFNESRQNLHMRQKRTLFSGTARTLQVGIGSTLKDGEDDIRHVHERLADETTEISSAQQTSAPWYLQSQNAEPHNANPFAARQRIPDFPENSPPIVQPLLTYISIDLGLDYLSVIDLRMLDPPPALGTGLIMIFGSARSEKHLNVSADRLCRWLRSTYKLTPTADGLLGRNELKLKLRRKARRSRMLGAVGAADSNTPDDGITTGWICVNVGEVENGPDLNFQEQRSELEGFVGFGKRSGGARIVVQMMTEEKRSEVDLESLWQAILGREGRKKEGEKRAWNRLDEEADAARDGLKLSKAGTLNSHQHQRPLLTTTSTQVPSGQVRGYHTSIRHQFTDSSRTIQHEKEIIGEDELEPHLLSSAHTGDTRRTNADNVNNRNWHEITPFDSLHPTGSFDSVTTALALRTHLDYLKRRKDSVAKKQLGAGEHDKSSTTFLTSFHDSFPAFPEIEHWLCAVELQCYALRLSHPGYTRFHLMQILRDMQSSGIWIPEQVFMLALEAILLSDHELDRKTISWQHHQKIGLNCFRRSLGFAFEVIERMEAHGYMGSNAYVFLLLLEAISASATVRVSGKTHKTKNIDHAQSVSDYDIDKLQHKFRRALILLYTPHEESDDQIYLALMQACIVTNHWDGLWESWRNLARMMKRRGPKMYTMIFSELAKTKHQVQCQRVLMECYPEMERENPPVSIEGDLARSILECLVVASVDTKAAPWDQIVEECKSGLGL